MVDISSEWVKERLKAVKYPGFSRDIVSFGLVKEVALDGSMITVALGLATKDPKIADGLVSEIKAVLLKEQGVTTVEVTIIALPSRLPTAPGEVKKPLQLEAVRYFVAVASGKGGVGKSSLTVNLAMALKKLLGPDKGVGIMDADIYGPSVPLMMGVEELPVVENDLIEPVERFGVKLMSMGVLIDTDAPVVWRGPMIIKAIGQFANDVNWGKLEILLVDLPPGTGDAQLSITQTLPLNGALIVTTPQLAAFSVARRGAMLFPKVNVPILGLVENMSDLYDPKSGVTLSVFGKGGGRLSAEALETEFLGSVPLDPLLREGSDLGVPVVLGHPEALSSQAIMAVAKGLLSQLEARNTQEPAV